MAARYVPKPEYELSAGQARRVLLRAQGLLGAPARRETVASMLRRLGAIQLDTISVLARSHELVPYARLGAVGRQRVEAAYWSSNGAPPRTFEYWAHAACVLPVEQWPLFAFRRRELRRRGRRWHTVDGRTCREVLARLAGEGPLTASELGGAKGGGPWWDWSAVKIAVEWLLDIGEVVCVRRQGWRRVYDLPDRALPRHALDSDPSDDECLARLVQLAGSALGVATRADLADYHRITLDRVDAAAPDSGLVPVHVAGWPGTSWADPEALATAPKGRHRTTLLSPFDSLVWDRKRTRRVFDFHHRLEAYLPRHKRVHGYFSMPLLAGGELRGRVDPGRAGRTLVARNVSLEHPAAVEQMAIALREAAEWVGCDDVRLERVEPVNVIPSLAAALGPDVSAAH